MSRKASPEAPPAPGTYHRVLRRYDLAADLANVQPPRFTALRQYKSQRAELDGVVAFTLFFPPGWRHEKAADRAMRFGWKDETERWHKAHGGPVAAAPKQSIEELVRAMDFPDLREKAKELGVRANGSRTSIEESVIAKLTSEAAA